MAHTGTAVLLDFDGTLVDSVFHHVLAWDDAFREAGFDVPLWRVHAGIGMGSARLTTWALGQNAIELGAALDQIVDTHERRFLARAETLRPTRGALALLDDLDQREVPHLVVTSSQGQMTDALVEALGRKDLQLLDNDVTLGSKPDPDPILAACEHLGAEPTRTTMVGDSPWDAEAAVRVGVRTVAVRTGGFSVPVLLEAGAAVVADDPRELLGRL